VAQNQLQISRNHTYYLHENQEAKIRYLNFKHEDDVLVGNVTQIADSFLMIDSQKIFYSSMINVAFSLKNKSKHFRKVANRLLIPQEIAAAGFGAGFIWLLSPLSYNNGKGGHDYYPPAFYVVFFSALFTAAYLPVDLIAIGLLTFNKTHFYVFKKDSASKRFCKISVVHSSPPK
jgi:hypothetical protein